MIILFFFNKSEMEIYESKSQDEQKSLIQALLKTNVGKEVINELLFNHRLMKLCNNSNTFKDKDKDIVKELVIHEDSWTMCLNYQKRVVEQARTIPDNWRLYFNHMVNQGHEDTFWDIFSLFSPDTDTDSIPSFENILPNYFSSSSAKWDPNLPGIILYGIKDKKALEIEIAKHPDDETLLGAVLHGLLLKTLKNVSETRSKSNGINCKYRIISN